MGFVGTLAVVAALAASGPAVAARANTVPFGPDTSFQWSNSVSASVLTAHAFTPSTAVEVPVGSSAVKIFVKITNGTADELDVSATTVDVKSGVDGDQATQIDDPLSGLSSGLSGTIAPGHSATAAYGFVVPTRDLGVIDVEVAPDYNYDVAIFEGAAS